MSEFDRREQSQAEGDLSGASLGRHTLSAEALAEAVTLLERNDASGALALLGGLKDVESAPAPLRHEYYVQLAWASFRNGSNKSPEQQAHYGTALAAAEKAGEDEQTLPCIASVLAQSEAHRDDERLFAIAAKVDLISHPGILNALVIRAGKGGMDQQFLEQVDSLVERVFSAPGVYDAKSSVLGHIAQNYGKLCLNVFGDAPLAARWFTNALPFYDMDRKTDLPHLGAAYSWLGQALQRQGLIDQCYAAETAAQAIKMLAAGDAYGNDQKVVQSAEARQRLRSLIARRGAAVELASRRSRD